MADIRRLPAAQRILVARLSGTAARYATGRGEGDPVAALHGISHDPVLLGLAAAGYLVTVEWEPDNRHAPEALRWLQEAGADEATMAEEAVRVRQRLGHLPHSV